MAIEQVRQKARQEAEAEALSARQLQERAFNPRGIAQHPRFTLTLSVWGAALIGLSVLALSSVDIARVSMVAGLGALGHSARFVFPAIGAVIGAVGAFVLAYILVQLASLPVRLRPAAALEHGRVRPIDTDELGSESLDAPLEEAPFATSIEPEVDCEPSRDEVLELHAVIESGDEGVFELNALTELDPPLDEDDEPEAEEAAELFRSPEPGLNIDAFRQILADENRRYEERELAAGREPIDIGPAPTIGSIAPQAASAIDKLRDTPPEELSLVQLVERFAAALHDAQARSLHDLSTDRLVHESAARERALAKALKALEIFTGRGFGADSPSAFTDVPNGNEAAIDETERDLRDALSKLQTLRGAA